MSKIDIDKFVASVYKHEVQKLLSGGQWSTTLWTLDEVLREQGLKYKAGEIVEIEPNLSNVSENGKDCKPANLSKSCKDLQESEDEKIRKAILELVRQSSEILEKKNQERMLAWLERQGDKHPDPYNGISFEYNGHIWGMCARDNGVDISCDKHLIKHLEKQAQVKESTISQHENRTCEENGNSLTYEDEKVRKALIDFFGKGAKCGAQTNGVYDKDIIAWLERQKPIEQQMYWTEEEIEPIISDYLCGREHYGGMIGRLCHLKPKQKQTEWGEDDKAFLDDILCKLEHDLILNKDEKDWIKSLKDRVGCEANCTTTKEWSEEDEQHIDSLLKRLDSLCRNKFERTRFAISEDRDWLKSIKERIQKGE